MIRAAAKNFLRVAVLVDPADYGPVLTELGARSGSLAMATRHRLAVKAFALTSAYDASITSYLLQRPYAEVAACYDMEGRG